MENGNESVVSKANAIRPPSIFVMKQHLHVKFCLNQM